jgi:hypothetical protein
MGFTQRINVIVETRSTSTYSFILLFSLNLKRNAILVQDKDVIFAKFAQIQSNSFKIMVSSVSEEIVSSTTRSAYTIVQIRTTQELKEDVRKLKKYGMEEECKGLLDFLERTNAYESIREHFHANTKVYRWDFKYKDDEWYAFFEDMDKHRDYIYDGEYDDYLESLEG